MIKIGDIISNRYSVLRHLGTGGMAVVFECKDLYSNRVVAVKILKEEIMDDVNAVESFTHEVKSSVSMSHPNIVEIYADGIFENRPYLVMEYLETQSLLDKLEYFTKFSVYEACQIMIQLLDAIQYTHNHNIIHRDIKPQNVFYLSNGTIKLTDFGISSDEKNPGIAGKIIGSVQYLAPEVFTKNEFSIASDLYAAGVTFYQLVTGKLPFDGTSDYIANCQIKSKFPKAINETPTLPEKIDEIIGKAVLKNPKLRYSSANEFKNAIIDFLNGKNNKVSFLKRIFG